VSRSRSIKYVQRSDGKQPFVGDGAKRTSFLQVTGRTDVGRDRIENEREGSLWVGWVPVILGRVATSACSHLLGSSGGRCTGRYLFE